MTTRFAVVLTVVAVCLGSLALAQPAGSPDPPLVNWTAPPYWTLPVVERAEGEPGGGMNAQAQGMTAEPQALPSSPLPFVAITPCRVADTRGNGFTGQYGPPALVSGGSRSFTITGQCGIPSGAQAVSFNFTIVGMTTSGDIRVFPAGGTLPLVSTQNWTASTGVIANAAVVPLGASGDITVHLDGLGSVNLVIDVNGYYGPESVVTSLTGGASTLTGDVTLAAGSNVTITPSGQTLTIAATGGPGGTLPAGTAGQTLYSNGSGWLANSFLYNSGSAIGIGTTGPNEQLEITGNLRLPLSSPSSGQIKLGNHCFIHNYGSLNTFVGETAGNFTQTGYGNTGVGYGSLNADQNGYSNSAVGRESLASNTSGAANTAVGMWSLKNNTSADANTAVGGTSLAANTTGAYNTGVGGDSMGANTIGQFNTALGALSLEANTVASRNTAIGYQALHDQSYANSNTAWDTDNTALGADALHSNQPANGTGTSGAVNTALGSKSMFSNTTGWSNTAVGYNSLWNNHTGLSNTAVGVNSLYGASQAGSYNTAVGVNAGYNASGSGSVFLGFGAGFSEASSNRLHIANSSSSTLIYGQFDTGMVAINATDPMAELDVNGHIRSRNWSGTGTFPVCRDGNGILISCSSDARLKTNIVALTEEKDVLTVLAGLRGVAFDWDTANPRAASAGQRRQIGFIAQEVEAVLPEVVHVEADGYRSMDYAKLTALLVEVAKAQEGKIDAQRAQIEALLARLAAMEARLVGK